ncbi:MULTISPECIES: DUF3302 domain-containing protein [Vibrio]|uniref:Inner membrane protein YiaW n=2 Tax=Vibrio TaxID=662 RepID=U2ZL51_VIBPR|nr:MULTISPECIES: DUF3302 domain-containing protein [Vibrio]NAX19753.1 DUF3302 domain-containing protein [Vibrio sp. V39_P1S14PM300]NAX27411.1 DUF3302 domain-containing protein [Vibrio sp. V38_P2S17PM301]NAX31761.1 DUF3302 domain-containing protein [Vibrio sp. V37_P2S8PM304]GAD68471.1 hypothetical protein VPR01S_13_01360 [Vibrio proteolyticus NBRC 13287]
MNLTLDYLSLAILFVVLLIFVYGLIVLHDIPYEMAKKRNHPHQEAIHVAGWISLFFLHVIWPFLWIWAVLYDPDTKRWRGMQTEVTQEQYDQLLARIEQLEQHNEVK